MQFSVEVCYDFNFEEYTTGSTPVAFSGGSRTRDFYD